MNASYPTAGNLRKKTFRQLVDALSEQYEFQEVDISLFPDSIVDICRSSALNAVTNINQLDSDSFIFHAFVCSPIAKNGLQLYTNSRSDEPLYLIIEEATFYMNSNCSRLLLQATVDLGYDEMDKEHNTALYSNYQAASKLLASGI